MRRLIVIVEGDTEKEFVDRVLAPYLNQNGISIINAYKISKTNGGLRHYSNLRKDLVKAVNENNVLVTTLIDYYALPADFPEYANAHKIANKGDRLECLEKAIVNDIAGDGTYQTFYPISSCMNLRRLFLLTLKESSISSIIRMRIIIS